jgi:hypothetical protein
MVWFFSRGSDELQVDVRYDNDASEFVVTRRFANGRVEAERFGTVERCRARLAALEQKLESERWLNSGPPLLVPEGFPKKPFPNKH